MTTCLSVSPDPVLTAGGTARICYGPDASKANGSVTVTIRSSAGDIQTVDIALDGDGYGCKEWTVPTWVSATFNTPGCDEVYRAIA